MQIKGRLVIPTSISPGALADWKRRMIGQKLKDVSLDAPIGKVTKVSSDEADEVVVTYVIYDWAARRLREKVKGVGGLSISSAPRKCYAPKGTCPGGRCAGVTLPRCPAYLLVDPKGKQ